ncbi:hypothetical protein [Roseinatronobacter bogoriensis]|uniref:hypothetical protein n=1 Tax=Roseinatronobacter bogoriensis TaxID=119542 RepID=UPI001064595B|nr:hypothetical protein [Rhodobaca]MBB4208963.1 hypothetical protein [Rhodobaca bogoriensis DSM 18756]TDW37612.1 hypothetical protein LY39_02707 [Rhodobaca barguzinensis]TDY68222.1 hypothetical protein EV660_106128 [Rhodobaca bogoriensis DSM 18756]
MANPKNSRMTSQEARSKEALKLKQDSQMKQVPYPTDKTPGLGMKRIEHIDQAPSGALDDVGEKPSRERSRERR